MSRQSLRPLLWGAVVAILIGGLPVSAQEPNGSVAGRLDLDLVDASEGTAYLLDTEGSSYDVVAETNIRIGNEGNPIFTFREVPPGVYIVDTVTNTTAYTYYPGTSSLDEAEPLTVKPGEQKTISITVTEPAEIVVDITGEDDFIEHEYPFAINGDVRRDLTSPSGWRGSAPTAVEEDVITVGAGSWYVSGANTDKDESVYLYYFPEWMDDTPYSLPFEGDLVTLAPGERVSVDIELDLFWDDMYGSPFFGDIYWMQRTGLTQGCDDDLFCTDAELTRGEMAAFLARALRLPQAESAGFTDTGDSIFENDIDRVAAAGITYGCNPPENDQFCPEDPVERGAMAAFLVRAMGYEEQDSEFVDDEGSVFEDDIEKLATAGVTLGCNPPDNDRFCPGENVTRGEMAAFLRRATGGVIQPKTAAFAPFVEPDGRVRRYGD